MNTLSPSAIRLNLGCGFRKYDGYINVDSAPECAPDVVWDMERTPWPFETDSVSEIKLEHVLEHVGATTDRYLAIWKEIYRVCQHGAIIDIMVPHYNHENFSHDPTHVRPITPIGIAMLSQARNIADAEAGGRETKLGLFTRVDIDLDGKDIETLYTGKIAEEVNSGRISHEQLAHLLEHQNNIAVEYRMRARVVKPERGLDWLRAHGYQIN